MSRYIKVLNEDGTFTEKKVYLDEDMDSFAEWCDLNGYRQVLRGRWVRSISFEDNLTTDQLRGLWEDWKLAQQREEEQK